MPVDDAGQTRSASDYSVNQVASQIRLLLPVFNFLLRILSPYSAAPTAVMRVVSTLLKAQRQYF
jgi:hypothetical protein